MIVRVVRGSLRLAGGIALIAVLALAMTPAAAAVRVADRVDAAGNFVGETIPAAPMSDVPAAGNLAAFRPTQLRGARAVAVIPIEFTGLPLPYTTDQIRQTVFAGGNSVNAFMRETSFGAVSLTGRDRADGDVYPTVQIASDPATCAEDTYSAAALASLRAQGFSTLTGNGTDGYQHYIYLWPRLASCGYAGLGSVPGRDTWINGSLSVSVLSHELGHNFGLAHANALSCRDGTGAAVVLSDICSSVAYGDPFETMGDRGMHFSAMSKTFLGWFAAGQSVRVTSSATITIETASVAGPGVKSIEIPRGTSQSWFIEARSIAGQYDNFAPTAQAIQGVLIRRHAEGTVFAAESELLDAHPATAGVADAAFTPGEVFTDPLGGLRVEVIARTATAATVAITIGGVPPPPPTSPPPPTTTPQPPAGGTSHSGTGVAVTTDRAVARGWASRIAVRRIANGRAVVSGKVITRAKTCRYRLTATRALTGRCKRLTSAIGWRVLRNVRARKYVTIVAVSASGKVLMRRRLLVPTQVGDYRYYRV